MKTARAGKLLNTSQYNFDIHGTNRLVDTIALSNYVKTAK
jgi:hypothetical protein